VFPKILASRIKWIRDCVRVVEQDSAAVDIGDVIVEGSAVEDESESSYTSAAEDAVEDVSHKQEISQLIARRQQLADRVAEQVGIHFMLDLQLRVM